MLKTIRRSPRWRARLIILLVLYFTFLGGTFTTDFSYWPRVAHHIIVTVLLVGWVISVLRRGQPLPSTPLDLPMVAILISCVVATIFAVDPRVSLEALWQIGFHILLFYLLVDIMRVWNPRTVLEPIFFTAAVVILVGLLEFISWYFGLGWLSLFQQGWFQLGGLRDPIPPVIYRISFTLNVSTFLSGYLALLTPIGLAWWISASKPDTRRGLGIWLVGALVVQLLSFSRGGLLSLAVSLPTFGVLYGVGLANWRERLGHVSHDWRVRVGIAGMLVVLGIAGSLWLRQSGLAGHTTGDNVRMDLWQSAWQIGLAHPLTGVGPYGFGRAMRLFRNPVITGDHFTSAHSIPLQFWAESGLIGVVALIALVSAIAWVGWRRWRSADGAENVRLAGVIAALAGFAAQNQFDTLASTSILLPCLALVAFLVAPIQHDCERVPVRMLRTLPIFLLGLITLSAIGWGISDVAQYHFTQAVRLSGKGDFAGAVRSIQTAERLDPAMGYYQAQEAYYLGRLAAQNDAYLEEALTAYDALLSREDTYGLNKANHAMLLAQSGQDDEALAAMRAAQVLNPRDVRYALWTGVLAEQGGDPRAALEEYEKALEARPQWVGSPYWEQTSLRSEARVLFLKSHGLEDWAPETLARLSPECWPVSVPLRQQALSTEQRLSCQGEVSLRISGDIPDALIWLNRAIEASTTSPWPYLLRAEVYVEIGDLDMAERDAQMALFLKDNRANYLLGRISEIRGDVDAAISAYQKSIPLAFQVQGWDAAVYARRGDVGLLPQLDAPGPSRYDFAPALALSELYDRQGRDSEAQAVRDLIRWLDPYFDFSLPDGTQ